MGLQEILGWGSRQHLCRKLSLHGTNPWSVRSLRPRAALHHNLHWLPMVRKINPQFPILAYKVLPSGPE